MPVLSLYFPAKLLLPSNLWYRKKVIVVG
jgi:hypothetical protein